MERETRRTVLVRGTGSIGMRHIHALRALGHRVIAVPARSARAGELATLGIEVMPGMREAVELGASAAVIATDTGRHVPDALEAIELGCDVLVEKPVAPTAIAAGVLAMRAAEKKRKVFVAYCLRFHEGLLLFRRRLAEIGDVHAVRIACQSFLPSWRPERPYRESYSARAEEGGVLRDLSHEIDYALWLFGQPSGALRALLPSTSRLRIEAEESADLLWTSASGAAVSLRLDYLTRVARRTMLAQGALGEIEWDAVGGAVQSRQHGMPEERQSVGHDRDRMMQAQAEAFLAECDGRPAPELCSLSEGINVMSICDAARRSASFGKESR